MKEISEIRQNRLDAKKRAFALQFLGDTRCLSKRLDLKEAVNVTEIIEQTGLFGILDVLIDFKLDKYAIEKFYYHGYSNTKPYLFISDIIKIVYGMPKDKIKEEFYYYFDDATIDRLSRPSMNNRMLLSFCYDTNDTYIFIPSKEDLDDRLMEKYKGRYVFNYVEDDEDEWDNYREKKIFQKVDGRLFRAVHFLVCQGYDFPEIESLINKNIKDIVFKQKNCKKRIVLNKEYAIKISDNILSIVRFCEKNCYKILNPEYMFDSQYNEIFLKAPNGEQIILNKSYLESDVDKFILLQDILENNNFRISNLICLCDKRVENIVLKYVDENKNEHRIIFKRGMLHLISDELLITLSKAYENGLSFKDGDNLFDVNQEYIVVIDSNGVEYSVIRNQLSGMLEIINKCKESNFSINLSQLFNVDQIMIELTDDRNRTAVVDRSRIMFLMDVYSLLTKNGFTFDDYNNLFDEGQQYIVCRDKQKKEIILSRKQINKIIKLKSLSFNEESELTDSDKDLLSMLNNSVIKDKLFEWLPYTAKKWIPSSAIISKIPAERSYEFFHNNNHARLEILKNEYKAKNYSEMEGIVSLGYILGLFDSKESTSKRALEYILDYFLKKGVTANKLHTTYGAIDLRKGYNKNFADFFMRHYSVDSGAFIEPDLGTNMVGELYEKFDDILKSRPEKLIKTNTINKLLTPMDAMASITSFKVNRELLGEKVNDERYIYLAELLTKFGASDNEIKWAISLYSEALAIDEKNVIIPYIEDSTPSLMKFNSHLKSDPQAFLSGRKTNCCSKYGGQAQDRLAHIITDPNWRYVTFTSPNRTFFDGLVWYDEKEKVVCIDNVEGQFSVIDKHNSESIPLMANTVIRYADGIYLKMHELGIPCLKVNVGKDPGTASWQIFRYASQQNLINEDDNPSDYPIRNCISTDAKKQFTITSEKTLCRRKRN